MNKKRIEQLEHENNLYEAKIQAMEFQIAHLHVELDAARENSSGDTVASF